jgi:hypothetical protein
MFQRKPTEALSNDELLSSLIAALDEERRAAHAVLANLEAVEAQGIPLERSLAHAVVAQVDEHAEQEASEGEYPAEEAFLRLLATTALLERVDYVRELMNDPQADLATIIERALEELIIEVDADLLEPD